MLKAALLALPAAAAYDFASSSDVENLLGASAKFVSVPDLIIVRRTTYTAESPFGGFFSSMLPADDVPMTRGFFEVTRYDDDADDFADDFADATDYFECPCSSDVAEYCSSDAFLEGEEDYATVYSKRLCLQKHVTQLTLTCLAHLESAPTVVEYCSEDILQNCAEVDPGENRVHTCLNAVETNTEPCAEYLESAFSEVDYSFPTVVNSLLASLSSLFDDIDDDMMPSERVITVTPTIFVGRVEEQEAPPEAPASMEAANFLFFGTLALLFVASFATAAAAIALAHFAIKKSMDQDAQKQNLQEPLLYEPPKLLF